VYFILCTLYFIRKVVSAVWAKLLPGLYEHFDAEASLPCVHPRPFLIVNNAADPRTPRAGVEAALRAVVSRLSGRAPPGEPPLQPPPLPPPGAARLNLGLALDVSVAAEPLPPDQWRRGHVVTPAMEEAIAAFLAHTVRDGHDTLPDQYGPAAAHLEVVAY